MSPAQCLRLGHGRRISPMTHSQQPRDGMNMWCVLHTWWKQLQQQRQRQQQQALRIASQLPDPMTESPVQPQQIRLCLSQTLCRAVGMVVAPSKLTATMACNLQRLVLQPQILGVRPVELSVIFRLAVIFNLVYQVALNLEILLSAVWRQVALVRLTRMLRVLTQVFMASFWEATVF